MNSISCRYWWYFGISVKEIMASFCHGNIAIPGGPSMEPFGHFWLQRSATKIEELMRSMEIVGWNLMPWTTIFFWRYIHHTRHTSMILLQIWMMSLHAMQKKVDASIWSFCCWQTSLQKPPQTCHSKVQKQRDGCSMVLAGAWRGTKGAPALGIC